MPPEASETPIDLDHHATTPCDPRVVEAMLPCFTEVYGNPSSRHAIGRRAADRVEKAREQVAGLLGCERREIVFTSGATESNNLALKGVAELARQRHRGEKPLHLVTAATEHKAVLDVCARLERRGFEVDYLPVAADGRIDPETVRGALRDETILVSLMLANNEIGVLHPIPEISRICRGRGVLLHCDAAQALALVACDVDRLGADLLSISGHKAYGPKGVGALYMRRRRPRVRLLPQSEGGGHERGHRSGTLNVPGIVGLGMACALVAAEREHDATRLASLRDRLLERLRRAFPELVVNGSLEHRLPNNLNVSIPGLDADRLIERLEGVALSSGAACSSPNQSGSYVIEALPGGHERAPGSLRFGLGRSTTGEAIERAADRLVEAIVALPPASPTPPLECGVVCEPAASL